MRREFKITVETRDDEAEGHVIIEDMTETGSMKLACPAVDGKIIGNREVALAFMMRMCAEQMFKRCFPEYKDNRQPMQHPEQHGDRIVPPGEWPHSSVTGIDPQQ